MTTSAAVAAPRRRGSPAAALAGERLGAGPPLLAALAAVLVFAGTLGNGFAYDDLWKLGQLRAGACPGDWLGTRGLPHLLHCLDFALWGERAAGFHATNLGLHALASALAAAAAFAVARSRAAALVAGLLFALHPVHVEAVASFANRKDLLAGAFVALALVLWRRRGWAAYGGALAAWGLAMWSKEAAAAALPALLLAADLLPLDGNPAAVRERLRRALRRSAPFALAAAAGLAAFWRPLAAALRPEAVARATELRAGSWGEAVATALAHAPDQLALLLLPLRLAADRAIVPAAGFGDPRALTGAALVALWIGAVAFAWRRAPVAAFALLWPPLMLAPAANLVPLTPFFVAERYLYVPSFGVCLLAGWLAARAMARRPRRRAVAAAACAALLVLAAVRSAAGAAAWRDDAALWRANLDAGHDTVRARLGLANAHLRAGRRGDQVEQLRAALALPAITPGQRWTVVRNLAVAGALGAAAEGCREILRGDPDDFDCHLIAARAAQARGEEAAALGHFRRAVAARPGDLEAAVETVRLLARLPPPLGDPRAAVELAERTRRRAPAPGPLLLDALATAHAAAGDPAAAALWRRRAVDAAREAGDGALAARLLAPRRPPPPG